MPVIIQPENFDAWLNPRTEDPHHVKPLLKPCPEETLTCHPVDPKVNHAANEGPHLIEPVTPPEQLGLF